MKSEDYNALLSKILLSIVQNTQDWGNGLGPFSRPAAEREKMDCSHCKPLEWAERRDSCKLKLTVKSGRHEAVALSVGNKKCLKTVDGAKGSATKH